ncbi:MAG: hypothetical protein IK077_15400 [Thermoguttaceae bacterium]|nr:hypothetical protein [Thermoguttaceae bacterium]
MLIKHTKRERAAFDICEWNEDVKAFIRPLDSFEAFVFNDYARDFFDKELSNEERFTAAFNAAKLVLVDENDAPLLTDDDFESVRYASFAPLFRVFSAVLKDTAPNDDVPSAKKN